MLHRLAPLAIITTLGLLFFSALVVHPTETFYSDHGDLLPYLIPVQRFLVRSWQETGELPLWCPYSLAGMPFVHDPQVGIFYPPHWLLLGLPERYVGAAVSWLLVLHVLAAGWGMYAYARSQGLVRPAALVAALGFMFAGKWLLHLFAAGHYTVAALAWLPLVLLWLEGAIRRGSPVRAVWAGCAFALIVLGAHPQYTFYTGLFVALWTLGPALEQAGYLGAGGPQSWRRSAAALTRWLGMGALAAVVACALSAVQLLPTAEAAGQTTRVNSPFVGFVASTLAGSVLSFFGLFGPPPRDVMWETQGGLSIVWLLAATLAVVEGRGRARFHAFVCLALLAYGLAGWILLQGLPGFRLFRIPSRIIMLTALPVALLAGTATHALFTAPDRPAWMHRQAPLVWRVLVVALHLLVGQLFLVVAVTGEAPRFHPYWAVCGVTLPLTLWLLARFSGSVRPSWKLAWGGILLADVWALSWPLVAVRSDAEVYAPSHCVRSLTEAGRQQGRVLDRDVPGEPGSTPLGSALPLLLRIETVRGYNPFDVHRYKEYVQFISDKDEPPDPGPFGIANFPIKNRNLLDLLGVRHVLQPTSLPPVLDGGRVEEVDPHPVAYCFVKGGVRQLPPYVLYANPHALPRAFVVAKAAPLPERQHVLTALKATDFRRTVLLEGFEPGPGAGAMQGTFRPAEIRDYRPNRVVIGVEGDSPGYLVLGDVWYPGWGVTVDGQPAPLYRANFVFRAAAVPAGRHEVVFTFAPASYRWGKVISIAALAVCVGIGLLAGARAVQCYGQTHSEMRVQSCTRVLQ